jgi:hypothetical protein
MKIAALSHIRLKRGKLRSTSTSFTNGTRERCIIIQHPSQARALHMLPRT